MNTRTPKVRDTYRAEIWLNAAQVSFLDSLYPDEELPIQVGLLIRDEMRASRRNTPGKPDPIASQGTVVALRPAKRPAKRPAMMRPRATDRAELSKVPVNESSGPLEPTKVPVKASKLPVAPKTAVATPPNPVTPPKHFPEPSQPAPAPTQPSPPSSPQPSSAKLQARPFIGKIHLDNPISQLQEICHKHQVRLPDYAFGHCEEGFSCECQVKVLGKQLATTGSGSNKKSAKRSAAVAALKQLGYS
ncbi:putative dsRNA-binding protein [Leptothoe sp. EHU-05/26/07-4]